jgi:PKD repeat protein
MIKYCTLLLFFLVLLFTGNVSGVTVFLSGTITDQTNTGVPDYKVYIKTDFSSPFHYYKTIYTDNNGYYADTVQNVPAYPVSFQISTYDCNNVSHTITSLSTNSPIIANFQICIPPYSGCRTAFTYDSIAGLDYQFTDHSVSNSNIISWNWNFGDPASGVNNLTSLQTPHHVYSGSGIYNVKLVIHAVNGCSDSLVKTVFIRIPEDRVIIFGHVFKDQTSVPIPNNPVMINTTLIEYSNVVYSDVNGFYVDTIQAIPEGIPISVATYDCNNILHSNTVFSIPSSVEVNFNICLNEQCRAGFLAVLDSNNKVQNTFLFQDLSYGDPTNWTWSFGDGSSSHDRNPIHQYTTHGNFKVALTITKEDSTGAWICFDSTSRSIQTSDYFNLGGLLFAGLFPINNPHYSGDTGVAYLYRAHNKWIVPVDTAHFTNLGYYTFLNVLEGTYIVKAGLTRGSAHYLKYLPVYTGDQIKWQNTSSFLLDHNMFDNTLHLIVGNDSISGPAMLKGFVIHKDDNVKLANSEVVLYNEDLVPFRSTLTDAEGNFEFSALPFGTYNLYPEVTGKYASIMRVILDSLHQIAEELQLDVFDQDVEGISPIGGTNDFTVGKIYPNPVTEDFLFEIQSPETVTTIQTKILTFTGEEIQKVNVTLVRGRNLINLPLRNVSSGMYFLVLTTEDGKIINTQKVIKN